jgi:hypothetical protein
VRVLRKTLRNLVLERLDERREFRESHSRAGLVVARRYAVVQSEEISAAVCIGEHDRDRHLAPHRGIVRLELVHFDNLLVGHELREVTVIRVGVRGRLAGFGRCVVEAEQIEWNFSMLS